MILVENSPNSELDAARQRSNILLPQTDESEEYETTNEDDPEDDGDETSNRDERYLPPLPSLGLNNYLNNLNINFHLNLNDRFNAFETSLWKFYENTQFPQFPPVSIPKPSKRSLEAITNLFKQISDEEAEERLKRQEFQEIQKKASAEVRRRLGPKLKSRLLRRSGSLSGSDNSFEEEEEESASIIDYDNQRSNLKNYISSSCDPQNKIDTDIIESGDRDVPKLNQHFWSQFLGFKTEANTKLDPSIAAGSGGPTTQSHPKPPINPFFNRVHLSTLEWTKCVLLTVLCIIRLLAIFVCLTVAILLAFVGSIGLSSEQMQAAPLTKWRRAIRWVIAHVVMRTVFFCVGFHWVRWIGKQASPEEAPILVVAPHSSYFDAFAVTLLGGPSVVAKDEARHIPFFGRLIDFTQPIYVKREERSSRAGCVSEIQRRVAEDGWQQVFIFPEGTCTNRSAMAQFKIGSFSAAAPVQPIILRYPNRIDSPTWTFDGPSPIWSAWVSLSQFHSSITVECLPVYVPNEAEKENSILYAENVQKVIAQALGVPTTNYSMEDGIVLARFSRTQIRNKLKKIWKIKGDLKLRESPTETTLVYEGTTSENFEWMIDYNRFQEIFHIQRDSEPNKEVQDLFNLFKQSDNDRIDMRAYLLLACLMYNEAKLDLLIAIMFKMYTAATEHEMSRINFMNFMINVFEATEKEADNLFNAGNQSEEPKQAITYSEFCRKILHRVEYIKLFAMEETGQRSGNFPRRSERDQFPVIKSKEE